MVITNAYYRIASEPAAAAVYSTVFGVQWLSFDLWKNVAAVLGVIASIIAALGVIHSKVIAPWIAKPVAKAVRGEMVEFVEIVFLESDVLREHVREITEETIALNLVPVVEMLRDHHNRLERIEKGTKFIADRVRARDVGEERRKA